MISHYFRFRWWDQRRRGGGGGTKKRIKARWGIESEEAVYLQFKQAREDDRVL